MFFFGALNIVVCLDFVVGRDAPMVGNFMTSYGPWHW